MNEIRGLIEATVKRIFNTEIDVQISRPEEKFGDYTTNVALMLAKKIAKNPREIAEKIVAGLPEDASIEKTEVAGPGFINITLTDESLLQSLTKKPAKPLLGKTIVAEYSDPNPFKVLHAGHVYTTVVGDGIATLLEHAGATVYRVNFGGDVGLHVGKTMWAIIKELGGELPEKLDFIESKKRPEWMASRYIEGNKAYNDNEEAIQLIKQYNKRVYKLHADQEKSTPFAQIYWKCREWSYEAFDLFYDRLGVKLDKYYPESETVEAGLKTVKENIPKVFQESDGAVVFKGDDYGLHTRVFINSQGLPTYEAKDIGLILNKNKDYDFDMSVVVTDNEQMQYMQVVLKAIEQIYPDLARATNYVPHGKLKLKGGIKMSSRVGNIIKATDVIDVTNDALEKSGRPVDDSVMLAAIKYAFLKVRIGGDIIYDPEESVSLQGSSGPYLQYAHARACSILAKVKISGSSEECLEKSERSLARKISQYPEAVETAVNDLMPHHVATYLYELAQVFNRFYEKNRVIGDEREGLRLQLVGAYKDVLKDGLELLNIQAPERM